ncbi:hypothetical protein DAPPUDRAFT_100697 [Daphnia pulex]|uniref:Uncharacterized protein n=1 Tax=Daphnia pulex TaxID=6669 RepID=E9GB49_DAPPU|nr:hypothetical protein DAPPUDRAFT_100697 [Daphnia pulex]|eukprot:EFX83370.1 hypothetical protein DAPPUDRAFT_100697 [Daphnia pulex]
MKKKNAATDGTQERKKKKRTGHGPHSIHLSANEFKKQPKSASPFFLRCARGAYIIKGHASGHGHFTPKTKNILPNGRHCSKRRTTMTQSVMKGVPRPGPYRNSRTCWALDRLLLGRRGFQTERRRQTAKRIGAAHPSAIKKIRGRPCVGTANIPSSSKEMRRLFVGKCFPNNETNERQMPISTDARVCWELSRKGLISSSSSSSCVSFFRKTDDENID